MLVGLATRWLEQESLVDVGDDASTRDGSFDEFVELLVTPDCQLQMSRHNPFRLEILATITC